jgi:putative phage-type endonuclease
MLTDEQLERRQRSLGASEIAAVVGLDPRKTVVDIWATKRRGQLLEHAPIIANDVEPEPDEPLAVAGRIDTDPRQLGNLFEDAIARAYEHRTGNLVAPSPGTVEHAAKSWATCTPDRLIVDGGLECKLVGAWMRKDWPSDGIPEYVSLQCQWSMHVTGAEAWDVAALVDGTDLRIFRVERDEELIVDIDDMATDFWRDHVLGDLMPPIDRPDAALRILQARWRQDDGTTATAKAEASEVVRRLVLAQERERDAKTEVATMKAILCGMTGSARSLAGPWGRFDWPSHQGTPRWKEIAEELAGGVVPAAVVERHRGDGFRAAKIYPHREWKRRLIESTQEVTT